jgi:glycosyltransferase involved in cell wall biosynthesis
MKVLVVTNMWPRGDVVHNGIFVAEQVHDLRRLGLEVDVLHVRGSDGWWTYLGAAAGVHRTASAGYDVVHAHYGLTGAVARAQLSAPVVTTFHGSDVAIGWQRAISFAVARTTTPIFVSRRDALRLRMGKADVIPFGVDTRAFYPRPKSDARDELGWGDEPRVVFPAAFSNPVKDSVLFHAVADRLDAALPNPVVRVELAGLGRHEVAAVLAASDLVLMTSRSEGSPVTVKEALAVGTPVVSVDVGDVANLLEGLPGCRVVASRDPDLLAAAAAEGLGSSSVDALRARAEAYERLALANRVLEVYRRLV